MTMNAAQQRTTEHLTAEDDIVGMYWAESSVPPSQPGHVVVVGIDQGTETEERWGELDAEGRWVREVVR